MSVLRKYNRYISAGFVVGCYIFSPSLEKSNAYWPGTVGAAPAMGTHTQIGQIACDNYRNYLMSQYTWTDINCHLETGYDAIQSHWSNEFEWGLVNEDYLMKVYVTPPGPGNPTGAFEYTSPLRHFWKPQGGEGNGLAGYDSAYERAIELWAVARNSYYGGNYPGAYCALGQIGHLVGDMGVPAHANLDIHLNGSDWYENTYITGTFPAGTYTTSLIYFGDSLKDIMSSLAECSNKFDSGPIGGGVFSCDGWVDDGKRSEGGFTNQEGDEIAQECYPGAIAGVGGLINLWFEEIKPHGSMQGSNNGQRFSGLKGVPLKALFHSYGYSGHESDFMEKVEFYSTIKDKPKIPDDFRLCGTATSRDSNWYFNYNWTNTINDGKVWVYCIGKDYGGCDSSYHPGALIWVSIDSTNPEGENFSD